MGPNFHYFDPIIDLHQVMQIWLDSTRSQLNPIAIPSVVAPALAKCKGHYGQVKHVPSLPKNISGLQINIFQREWRFTTNDYSSSSILTSIVYFYNNVSPRVTITAIRYGTKTAFMLFATTCSASINQLLTQDGDSSGFCRFQYHETAHTFLRRFIIKACPTHQ